MITDIIRAAHAWYLHYFIQKAVEALLFRHLFGSWSRSVLVLYIGRCKGAWDSSQ
jgi:hypothetical protein